MKECDDLDSSFNNAAGGSDLIFPLKESNDDARDYCKYYPLRVC